MKAQEWLEKTADELDSQDRFEVVGEPNVEHIVRLPDGTCRTYSSQLRRIANALRAQSLQIELGE